MSRSAGSGEAVRGRATLAFGIGVLRWGSVAWMAVLAVLTNDQLRQPELAWATLAAASVWTAWLTVRRPLWTLKGLIADLAFGVAVIVVSGFAGQLGGLDDADVPAFETPYPVTAALTWGVAFGIRGGLLAGGVLGLALVAGRLANGVPLADLGTAEQAVSLAAGTVNFLLAGGGIGVVTALLQRSWAHLRLAQEESARERERAARLAERETLARQIHDSVLQALAMVHKRGRELAAAGPVAPGEVAALAELAGGQERALRTLILRAPGDGDLTGAKAGTSSLRSALEALAVERPSGGPEVSVGAVGPLQLPAGCVTELRDAVKQALDNVAEHAGATRAWVFAEEDGGEVVVTVRDDGAGFDFDEKALRAAGKIGLLKSIIGRAEQLGGSARVDSAPGRGTEIELRVPLMGGTMQPSQQRDGRE